MFSGDADATVQLAYELARLNKGIRAEYVPYFNEALKENLDILAEKIFDMAFSKRTLDDYYDKKQSDAILRNHRNSYRSWHRSDTRYWHLLKNRETEEYGYPNYPGMLTPTTEGAFFKGEIILYDDEPYYSVTMFYPRRRTYGHSGATHWLKNNLAGHFYNAESVCRGGFPLSPSKLFKATMEDGQIISEGGEIPRSEGVVQHPPYPPIIESRIQITHPAGDYVYQLPKKDTGAFYDEFEGEQYLLKMLLED